MLYQIKGTILWLQIGFQIRIFIWLLISSSGTWCEGAVGKRSWRNGAVGKLKLKFKSIKLESSLKLQYELYNFDQYFSI